MSQDRFSFLKDRISAKNTDHQIRSLFESMDNELQDEIEDKNKRESDELVIADPKEVDTMTEPVVEPKSVEEDPATKNFIEPEEDEDIVEEDPQEQKLIDTIEKDSGEDMDDYVNSDEDEENREETA